MFSIIVPCYNVEKYIEKTIKSVLNQTYSNFELILVNDGSSDKTLEILKKYEKTDYRIVVINKENGGVSSARNKGLEVAKGNYIYFLDGDDTIEYDLLENAKVVFDKNIDIDIFSFAFDIVDKDNNVLESYSFKNYDKKTISSNQFFSLYLNKKIRQSMCSFIIKKNILFKNNLRFSEDISYGEDQELQLKAIFHSNNIYYDIKCYFHYLKRESSAVNKKINLKRIDLIKSFFKLREYFKSVGIEKVVLQQLDNYIGMVFIYLLKEGKKKDGDFLYFSELDKFKQCLNNVKFSFSKYGIASYILAKSYLKFPKIIIKFM